MKKSFWFGFLALLILVISSCSQKKETVSVQNEKAQKFAFDIFYYGITGNVQVKENKEFAQKIILPQRLKKMLLHRVVVHENNTTQILYLFEVLYPQSRGLIDSYGFYVPEADNGRWVDKLVFQIQEDMVGTQITEMLELNPVIQEILQEEEAIKNGKDVDAEAEISVEKILKDSQNRLKVMTYEKEIFLPQIKKDQRIFIHSDSKTNKVTRFFYNNDFRMNKKEIWSIPGISDAKLLSSEEYIFDDKTSLVKEMIVTQENSKLHTFYNSNETVAKTQLFEKRTVVENKSETVSETESDTAKETTKSWFWKKSETAWTYNKEGKITSEVLTEYAEPETEKSVEKVSFVKKQLFDYNKGNQDIPPDYEYYENNVLKNKIVYTDKGKYTSKVFFEQNFTVTSYYENNKKVKDVYDVGGIVRRVKTYE